MGFISIIFGWFGGLLGTVGTVYLVRKNKVFLPMVLIGLLFSMVDQLIVGVFFTFTTYILTFILIIITFIQSDKEEESSIKYVSIIIQSVILISVIIFGLLFYSIILPSSSLTISNSIDVIASSIAIPSWWLILKKERRFYWFYG